MKRDILILTVFLTLSASVLWLSLGRIAPAMAEAELRGSGPVVILDPGHGGEDGGTSDAAGGKESQLNLEIAQRTQYDMEMLMEVGMCKGIENYSRVLSVRKPGETGTTLLDYFPDDFLMFIDESHVTIPQVGAMYGGDFARKKNLVEYGFRLPSAYDNRPLNLRSLRKR